MTETKTTSDPFIIRLPIFGTNIQKFVRSFVKEYLIGRTHRVFLAAPCVLTAKLAENVVQPRIGGA